MVIRLRSDGFVQTTHNPLWTTTEYMEHAQENMKAIEEIMDGELLPILNFAPDHYVAHDAQEYYQKHKPLY